MHLRLIEHAPGPAAWNMAVDDALFQLARTPTLRLYGWSPHAVSLGWFQRFADFADLPPGTPVVRRTTGGGAIHHGDEITFALVVSPDLLPRDVAASYGLLHDAAIGALAAAGVVAERFAGGSPAAARPHDRWCYREPGRDDVVTVHGKLLGSAQRRVQRPTPRVLHHGSLVLQRPELTPFAAAAADAVAVDDALRARLRAGLAAAFAAALELPLAAGELPPAETTLAEQLAARQYGDPSFPRRR